MGICNKIIPLIVYYIILRLVTLCEVNDTIINVSDIVLSVCCKFTYFFLNIPCLQPPIPYQISTSFTLSYNIVYHIIYFPVHIIYTTLIYPVTTTVLSASFVLKIVSTLHQTMVHAASVCADLDCF